VKAKGIIAVIVGIAALVFYLSAYVVDETEQVVITQFGKVIGEPVTSPGLKFKIPIIQKATYFPKNLQTWDGDPGQIPTLEKTYIWVDSFALWKIVDPVKFFQTVSNMITAKARLDDIIDPSVRNAVTSFRLIEMVRNSNRKLDTMEIGLEDIQKEQAATYAITTGREKITRLILAQAKPKLEKFGIELVDVKIKRINYVDQVRKSVYDRMIAERNQIAEKYRSEGQGEAQKIQGDKERDLKQISSEAYRKAQEIKGKADAEATRIYADAFSVDPEFYSFYKTLETYRKALGKDSELILSTRSEFLKYMKGYKETP
jgi:membrane protease subunit HflC